MDHLVLRVTDDVTQRLQPLLSNLSSMAQQAQSPPSTSSQAPAVSLPGSNIQQVQGHAAIQATVKVPAVHDGVQSVLTSLSGEQNLLPGTFHSIPATGVAKSLDVPRGYCFKYHKGGYCSGCSFKHSCAKCDGPHQAINCNFHAFSKGNTSNLSKQHSNKTPSSWIIPNLLPRDAIHTIRTVGPGCFMAKTDIKNAF